MITEQAARKMWTHIRRLEKAIQKLELQQERKSSPKKSSEEKDKEIQKQLLTNRYN